MATGGVLPLDEQVKATAESPFDDTRADFILISSDGVAFHVYSTLLALISPVFEIMFKLPQGRYQDLYKGKTFVNVTDDSHKLHLLLTWCDPRCLTPSPTAMLEDLQAVLEIADKYGMETILKQAEMHLVEQKRFILDAPLRVFCIAVRFRLEAPAKQAAAQAIKVPFSQCKRCDEMKHLSAISYDSLIRYQTSCAYEARMVITDLRWLLGFNPFVACACPADPDTQCQVKQRSGHEWLAWLVEYLDRVDVALKKRLDGAVASDPALQDRTLLALSQGYDCQNCHRRGPRALIEISNFISERIHSKIADVDFTPEF